MNSKDAEFWKTEGINYLYWQGVPVYYEGEENARAVANLVGSNSVRDVGCGYGRLTSLYDPSKYVGFDICKAAIKKATRLLPEYKFFHWDYSPLPPAEVTMFINGPHLVNDDEILSLIEILCQNTNAVIFAEPMDTVWRNRWNYLPYKTYTRNIDTYDELLLTHQFKRVQTYVGTHLTIKAPYSAARWERL